MYKALIAAKNEATGELVYNEEEARNLIGKMDDEYILHLNRTYKDAEEWLDYYCM